MQSHELAQKFMELAKRDCIALRVLGADIDVADETIGFHAQQAVEKCLKAVLVLHAVEFRKTHNLDELIDLLHEYSLPTPPNMDALDALTPYAVLLRYDFAVNEPVSREQTSDLVKSIFAWASRLVNEANR